MVAAVSLAAFARDSLPQLANPLNQRQIDEFFRLVASGFCPLNPPLWGTLSQDPSFKVPQFWGIWGAARIYNRSEKLHRIHVN